MALTSSGRKLENSRADEQPAVLQPVQTGGGLGELLGGLLGGRAATPASPNGAAPGGLAPVLDLNGDGNALDDIRRLAGKLIR